MTHEQFKETYHLKDVKDSCDDRIFGSRSKLPKGMFDKDRPEAHSHVFLDNGTGVAYFNNGTRAKWNSIQRQLLPLGGTLGISGDFDGFIKFDPTNKPLVMKVLKLARIRVKRQLTEEQRERLKARLIQKGSR